MFEKIYSVRWADLDPNWHMRHTAYADYCTQTRFLWLQENGYPPERFLELSLGPVIFREETRYLREVRANSDIRVDLRVTVLDERGRWTIVHQVHRTDGELAAVHQVEGAWMDLKIRKLGLPPDDLLQAMKLVQVQPAG